MPNSQVELEGTLVVPSGAVAEIVATTLNGLGYQNVHINSQYKQATARERDTEQYGSDRWDFEYRVLIKWQEVTGSSNNNRENNAGGKDDGKDNELPPGSSRVQMNIFVSERQYLQQEHACEERCRNIWQALKESATQASSAQPQPSATYGSAQWASPDDLRKAWYMGELESGKFIVGRFGGNVISVPKNLTEEHVMVCGPTGSGKTRCIFIPNLIKRLATSALVTEAASGENPPPLYTKTAGWRHAAGHAILYFNPYDLTSTRINPLDAVQSFDDAVHISGLIIRNTQIAGKGANDPIWEQSETYLLNALILHAVGMRKGDRSKPGDNANLAYIRSLLRAGPDEIGELIKSSRIELARQEYNAFLKNTSPNFRYGVVSGLLVRLNPWVNKRIAALTEVTDFDPTALKDQLFTFYFVTSTKRPQFKPVAALAFNYVFDLLQAPGFRYPLTLFLDELTNYGYIPDLPEKLTHIRNQQIGAVLGIQHFIQLSKVYTDKEAILLTTQPGTRIYFRPRDSESALRISRSLGNTTKVLRKVAPSGAILEDERQRPLMDQSEVERLPKSRIIVMTPNTNPLLADTFHPTEHDDFCTVPPPPRRALKIDDHLVRMCEAAKDKPKWEPSSNDQGNGKTDQSTEGDDSMGSSSDANHTDGRDLEHGQRQTADNPESYENGAETMTSDDVTGDDPWSGSNSQECDDGWSDDPWS